jgi:hypothetical protein
MNVCIRRIAAASLDEDATPRATDRAIRDYLDGKTDGCDLFQALYGAVIDEPIPAAMLALVRRTG